MKKRQIIQLVCYLFIFCLGASLLINPSLGLDNENYLFFITMIFYGLATYVLYMLTRKKDDYEYLFTSLVSVIAGAAGVVFNSENSTLVLSLSLVGWMAMVSIIKLIKIDYYHDRGNLLWVVRTLAFVLFLIIGTLTCVNLYYNIEIQSLMLGFFFISVAVLESFDPFADYLMFKRVKNMNPNFKPMIVKEHAIVTVEDEPKAKVAPKVATPVKAEAKASSAKKVESKEVAVKETPTKTSSKATSVKKTTSTKTSPAKKTPTKSAAPKAQTKATTTSKKTTTSKTTSKTGTKKTGTIKTTAVKKTTSTKTASKPKTTAKKTTTTKSSK